VARLFDDPLEPPSAGLRLDLHHVLARHPMHEERRMEQTHPVGSLGFAPERFGVALRIGESDFHSFVGHD
jgi:hypothetical protein